MATLPTDLETRDSFRATPAHVQQPGGPPPLLALPVPARPGLCVSANLITSEPFAPWLPVFHRFFAHLLRLYAPAATYPNPDEISHHLNTNTYTLALYNSYAIGFLLFTEQLPNSPHDHPGPIGIDTLLVHPKQRRRLAGTYLVEELYCHAARRGVPALTASVASLPDADSFMESAGFVKVSPDATTAHDGSVRYNWVREIRTA